MAWRLGDKGMMYSAVCERLCGTVKEVVSTEEEVSKPMSACQGNVISFLMIHVNISQSCLSIIVDISVALSFSRSFVIRSRHLRQQQLSSPRVVIPRCRPPLLHGPDPPTYHRHPSYCSIGLYQVCYTRSLRIEHE